MRFNLFKYICILIFIVILVVFTVGYSTQPLLNVTVDITVKIPSVPNITKSTETIPVIVIYKYLLYMDKLINNNDNTTINYKDVNSTLNTISNIVKYAFIGVSVCIGLVIILSLIGLKFVSYIPLLLALTSMIIISIILIIIYSTNFIIDIIKNYISSQSTFINISNTKINYDKGSIMIGISTVLLFVNYILYMLLG